MIRRSLLMLFFLILCITSFAQHRRNSIKIGILRTSQGYNIGLASFERSIGERFSIQPEFGFRTWRSIEGTSWDRLNAFHFGIEGRCYFALRRGMRLSGFYAGPHASFDRMFWYEQGVAFSLVRRYWSMVGVSFGYQHAFGKHFGIDAGAKFGYGGTLVQYTYNSDGTIRYLTRFGNAFPGLVFIQGAILF